MERFLKFPLSEIFWKMDFGSESDSTDDIYEVERILDAKRKVS